MEKQLLFYVYQISKVLVFLKEKKVYHRDLKPENILITSFGLIKVGDFGLSEDVYTKNYFRQTSSDGVKLPVKWMAIESLKLGVFTEKSDVVSFKIHY